MAALSDAFPLLTFSSAVRDLGVTLGCQLTFATHINLLSRDCFYQLRQLRTVTRSLTQSVTSTLVHAFVANRLDYCCSLYAGLPACRLGSLDLVLRSAAHLIGGIPNFGHVSQYMLMFFTGSLLSSGFHIGSLPLSGASYFSLLLSTYVTSVVLLLVL